MIPYEELVAALSRWRARRGLPTGLGDALNDPPGGQSFDHSRDAEVELGEEQIEGVAFAHEGDVAGAQAAGYTDGELVGDQGAMMDFGALPSDEATKPAGLAGLVDLGDADAATVIQADPGAADQSEAAEPKPKRRGGRRRRK